MNIPLSLDEEDGMSEDEMVELPGGIDQLESIIEDHNKPEDNSKLIFSKHEKSGMQSWAPMVRSVGSLSNCVGYLWLCENRLKKSSM